VTTEFDLTEQFNRLIEARTAHAVPSPAKGPDGDVEDGGVPFEMEAGPVDNNDDWVAWRWLPSRVSEDELAELDALASPSCAPLRAYLRAHCHLLSHTRWAAHDVRLVPIPSDAPLGPFREQLDAWAPLVALGYLPFATYGDDYGPICVDLARGDEAPVVWLDHEQIHSLPEPLTRAQLEPNAQPLCPSLLEFLLGTLACAV
jgi:hypothetical protein